MKRVRMVRLGLLMSAAAVTMLVASSAAAAQIPVGQLTPSPAALEDCSSTSAYNEIQRSITSGTSYVVPTAGVLTSWSSSTVAEGSLSLAIYRPVGGQFLLLAADGPRLLPANSPPTSFPVSIPVLKGDLVGIAVPGEGSDCHFDTGMTGDVLAYQEGGIALGATTAFKAEDVEPSLRLNISATLLPPPAITSLSPASGAIGQNVTIAGANFASVSAVSFGGVPASAFRVDSEGQISASVPPGTGAVPVSVTTVAGTATSSQPFSYATPPPAPTCTVPKLKGKTLKSAKKRIRAADCRVGKLTRKAGATAKSGEIVKQVPKPGTTVPVDTKVKVTLGA